MKIIIPTSILRLRTDATFSAPIPEFIFYLCSLRALGKHNSYLANGKTQLVLLSPIMPVCDCLSKPVLYYQLN